MFRGNPSDRRSKTRTFTRQPHRFSGVQGNRFSLSKRNLIGGLLAIVLCTGVVAAVGMIDEPVASEPKRLRVILSDNTDQISPLQKSFVHNLTDPNVFLRDTEAGDLIVIAALTSDVYNPIETLFEKHDTGRGEKANWVTQTRSKVDMTWQTKIVEPFVDAIEKSMVLKNQPHTPLIEGMAALLNNPRFASIPDKQLLVISDGLQNTSASAYRNNLHRAPGNRLIASYPLNLDGAGVTFARIRRPNYLHLQTPRHWEWLEKAFYSGGASVVKRMEL